MGTTVIASAIIWAGVILAIAVVEPEAFRNLIIILGAGAAAHILLLGTTSKKHKNK